MEKGQLYSFKLKGDKTEFVGIIQSVGNDFILLKHLFTDYMIDGYLILNRKYIEHTNRDQKIVFIENVLKAKKIKFIDKVDIPLDSANDLLKWMLDVDKLILFTQKDSHVGFVGKILKLLSRSFYLQEMDVNAEWVKKPLLYRMSSIRSIDFDSDYLNSLDIYNQKILDVDI